MLSIRLYISDTIKTNYMSYNFSQEEVHYYENQRWQEFQQWEGYYLDEYSNRSKTFLEKKLKELEMNAVPTDKLSAEVSAIKQILKIN